MELEVTYMPQHERESIIAQTVKNYGGKLMSFIRPKVRNTEDAEDILQEVWYQFSNLTNIDDIANVGGWLFRVSNNKIIDKYRKKTTENLEDYVYEDDDGSFSIKDILLKFGNNFLLHWKSCPKSSELHLCIPKLKGKNYRKLLMNREKILKPLSVEKITP